jgi:hypothetical protein
MEEAALVSRLKKHDSANLLDKPGDLLDRQ